MEGTCEDPGEVERAVPAADRAVHWYGRADEDDQYVVGDHAYECDIDGCAEEGDKDNEESGRRHRHEGVIEDP